jgi:hypothetical protein
VFEGVQPPGVKHSPLLPQVVNVKEWRVGCPSGKAAAVVT